MNYFHKKQISFHILCSIFCVIELDKVFLNIFLC